MTVAHEHLSIDKDGFDAVYMEIESTLSFIGVPEAEATEFMAIIESHRSSVIGS